MKIYLFVDGSNLYGGQYDLFGPKKYLDFEKFISTVESKLKICFDKIYFYASYSPRPKKITKSIEKYLENEAMFYRSCRKIKKLVFIKGHRSPTSGKEKGVDVSLASDLVRYACEKKFKYGYLMTGDADFQRCIEIAIEKNRVMKILTLESRIPYGMAINFETNVFWYKKKTVVYGRNRVKYFEGVKDDVTDVK